MSTRFIPRPSVAPKDPSKHKAWAVWLTLTPEQKHAKVQVLMENGLKTAEAAHQLGISRQTLNGVLQQLKTHGWRRANDVSPDEVMRLAEQGLSTKEIAGQLQVSKDIVIARLKTAGWHNPWQDAANRLREQVNPLLKQDLTIKEISDRLGAEYSRVLRAKKVLVAAEPEGAYPAMFYRKRAGAGRKPRSKDGCLTRVSA